MKILVYSDAPVAPTGFGRVVANIFGPLIESGHLNADDVAFFGINFLGEPHGTVYRIWPAQVAASRDPDLYGKTRFCQMALGNVWGPFDILFFLLDHFTLAEPVTINNQLVQFVPGLVQALRSQHAQGRPPFQVVQYVPVDSDNVRPEWLTWMPDVVDAPVAYTDFGRRVCCDVEPRLADKMTVIPHGTNPELFFRVPPAQRAEFRRRVFGLPDSAPLIVNVNRNQPRKDPVRTLQVFRRVLQTRPDALLYLHMNVRDSAGVDLQRMAHNLRIPQGRVAFPVNFSEGVGVPNEQLNLIYNAADVLLTTARGEGWGLSVSESLTAGALVVAPNHTSFHEILADGRGLLVPPEAERQSMVMDNDQLRPVADARAMADAVVWALEHSAEARQIADRGMAWARALSWREKVAPLWWSLFERLGAPPAAAGVPRRYQFQAPANLT